MVELESFWEPLSALKFIGTKLITNMKPQGFCLASALDLGLRGSLWNYNSAVGFPITSPGELATHLLQDEFPEKQNPIQKLKSRNFIKGVCLRSTHERKAAGFDSKCFPASATSIYLYLCPLRFGNGIS